MNRGGSEPTPERRAGDDRRGGQPVGLRCPLWAAYALAVALPAATLLLRLALGFESGNDPGLVLFAIPILLSAYIGGLGPGLVSTAVAALVSSYFLLPPLYSYSVQTGLQNIAWLSLIAAGTLISVLTESLRHRRSNREWAPESPGRFPLERKVQMGFALALALLCAIGIVSYLSVVWLREDMARVEETYRVIASARSLHATVTDAETAQRGYTITGEDSYLDPYNRAVLDVENRLETLGKLTADNPVQQRRWQTLAPLVAERVRHSREIIDLRRSAGFVAAQAATASGKGKKIQDRIRDLVTEIVETERAMLKEREARAERSSRLTKAVISGGSALAFALVAVALLLIGEDFAGRRRADAALRGAYDKLETRVQERTEELARSNESLRESQLRLAGVVDSAMDAIVSVDAEQRVVLFNAAAENMFGRAAETMIGRPLDDLLPERFRAGHRNHIRRFAQTGITSRQMSALGAVTGLRADGQEFPIEASISQIETGGEKLFTVILRDITERRRAEDEIRRNMERIQALNEIDKAITSTLDPRGVLEILLEKVEFFLPVAAASSVRLLDPATGAFEYIASRGVRREEWPSRQRGLQLGLTWRIIQTGMPLAVRDLGGDPLIGSPEFFRRYGLVSYLGVPLIAKEKTVGVLAIYTKADHEFSVEETQFLITLAGQAAISIHNAQLYEQAVSANRAKGEFLSVMSHELRTPLSITMGYAGMIKEGLLGAITPQQAEALQKVLNQSADQLRMINDIMETTFFESRAATVERQLIDLSELFRHLKADLEATREKNQAALVWEYPRGPLPIVTDSRKLRQIVQNLVSNAIKFTDRGKIFVSATTVSRSPHLPLFDGGKGKPQSLDQWLEIKVRDTGRGIPPDKLEAIFDKFYQLDTSQTRLYGGLGLGLYITKRFTELLGGKITVESEVSEGSTFTVTIPYSN